MILTYSFYSTTTGLFATSQFSTSDHAGYLGDLALNTPTGYAAILGAYDPQRQQVNLSTLAVIAYIPPSPTPTSYYQWNTTTLRWELTTARAAVVAQNAAATLQIAALQAQAINVLIQWAAGVNVITNLATLVSLNLQIVAQQALIVP